MKKESTWILRSAPERAATAKRLVETLLSARDPFNLALWQAGWIPLFIVMEAWTPERKREVISQAANLGCRYVEHIQSGDYDISLWWSTDLSCHVVGINNGQHSPFEAEAQTTRQLDTVSHLPLGAIRRTLQSWLDEYGPLIVGSVVPERNEFYLRLVKRLLPGALYEPYHQNDFRYGFRLSNQ